METVICIHANVTTFRSEVKSWLADQKASVICLQETHLANHKQAEVIASMGYQVWSQPAAPTEGGTSGGLLVAAKRHLNFRNLANFIKEGKGRQILIGRFAGQDVAIGNIYLESST